ncbi:Pectin lyase [Ceratobasidium theobromae]|uniref:pectin lyase n=1 Tax=Ceratobasidium theobromae TaxID=1582974 RepID=A0A5N5QW93_9AGAM|nr:Pectin lyase [Ceratobasidium theobromae]
MSILLNSLVAALFCVRGAHAVGTAFGYATGTTGGGSAAAAVPTSTSQLVSWLGDSTARTILLDKIFDFTSTENNWCDNYYPSATKSTVTYYQAGINAITVGSNKTLLGKGSAGGIKGKGLRIAGGSNIIIQNIRISDLNAQYVWGGDAITIDGGSNIWIDHNYVVGIQIKNIGRQMIVTGYGAAKGVTISDNVFEGSGLTESLNLYPPLRQQAPLVMVGIIVIESFKRELNTPLGRHYWALYFTGATDTITFARNYVYMTSGRGPKVGGTSGYTQSIHMYNNYYVSVEGHALDAGTGASVIMEGNYFNVVTTPSVSGTAGYVYAAIDSSTASTCSSYLGRTCYTNKLWGALLQYSMLGTNIARLTRLSSGSLSRTDTAALSTLSSASVVKSASIMSADSVGSYVQSNAGLGIVN